MTRARWLLVAAAAGAALIGLSLAEGWLSHDRVLSGEGYRRVHVSLNAWRLGAVPVVPAGVIAALVAASAAATSLLRPARRSATRVAFGASVLALALFVAAAIPIGQDGHASSLDLTPGWALLVAIALAALMSAAAAVATRPGRRAVLATVVLALVLTLATAGARWWLLQASEGTGEHWSDGTYTRRDEAGNVVQTLTIEGGRFAIDDAWSGTWESSGWTVVLAEDPACPDARGTYHAHGEGPEGSDLRFVTVVDTCEEGDRSADLEAGIWKREP